MQGAGDGDASLGINEGTTGSSRDDLFQVCGGGSGSVQQRSMKDLVAGQCVHRLWYRKIADFEDNG